MYVVLPSKRLRVLVDSSMFFRPKAEQQYEVITVHQVAQLGSSVVVASATNPDVARSVCKLLNDSPLAEEIITAIRDGIFHCVPQFATQEAEVLQLFPKREK